MRGQFITFEGTEGAGKTTQIGILAERLKSLGKSVLIVREPGGTRVGERIREILKAPDLAGQLSAETELLLVAASRRELIRSVIQPALEEGTIVICDRFVDSTLAYQGYGRGLEEARIRGVMALVTGGLEPDLTLLIDIPLSLSKQRRRERERGGDASDSEAKPDRFEQSGDDFFTRVENGFRAIAAAEPSRVRVILGDGTIDAVTERIWAPVQRLLEQ